MMIVFTKEFLIMLKKRITVTQPSWDCQPRPPLLPLRTAGFSLLSSGHCAPFAMPSSSPPPCYPPSAALGTWSLCIGVVPVPSAGLALPSEPRNSI